jgi:hypothetical protein
MTIPGPSIILNIDDRIDFGAFADIFWPSGGAFVYKLFISFRHDTNVSQRLTNPENDQLRRKTFDSECRAYEIAAEDTFLCDHSPHSFRRCAIADVIDYDESVATNYLLECCYAMEYIDGIATKLRLLDDQLTHISEAGQAFRRAGIGYTTDASAFFATDPQKFKFIDFAVDAFPPPSW